MRRAECWTVRPWSSACSPLRPAFQRVTAPELSSTVMADYAHPLAIMAITGQASPRRPARASNCCTDLQIGTADHRTLLAQTVRGVGMGDPAGRRSVNAAVSRGCLQMHRLHPVPRLTTLKSVEAIRLGARDVGVQEHLHYLDQQVDVGG